ncbi:DMT family transporter [Shimia sp. FJ5]|uniref:DMT family transporter n=1 Tax=Shimia sp. FJ5 TaxID=3079054 RepID=UPI00260C7106|nr:DMT family transporter [Shimia sp. FJ5]MDV4145146.1 DMT family transporter [Shimia sp. FJ5]
MGQAIFIMFIAMSMIPSGDTAGKLLTMEHGASPLFVAWSRFVIGTALALPFLNGETARLLRDWRIWLRALLLTGGITSIQTALQTVPVADVFAAFFVGPLLSYALSALLLRETITPARTALIALGFVGVLLVVRPGLSPTPGIGFALLAGCFYGAFLTASRWLSSVGRPTSLFFTQLALSALFLTPFAYDSLPPLTATVGALTVASALFSAGGNLLLLYAYARAPASQLAPLVYFQLIAATGLGWAVFSDLPDAWTLTGLALIITSGLASALLATRPAKA